MNPFNFINDIIERWRFGDMCRPGPAISPEPPATTPPEAPVSRPRMITRVGAWAGSALIRDPLDNVLAAKAMGLDEIHVMVADHSAWRREHAFSDRPTREEGGGRRAASIASLVKVGQVCAEAGIDVGLTTWVMPHGHYIDGCTGYLLEAARAMAAAGCHVTEIIFDAEEPWTRAVGTEPFGKTAGIRAWNRSAAMLRDALAPLRERPYEVRFGVTGIGYAREPALDPIAEWCDFAVPQVYATVNNGLDPRKSPKIFADRWTRMFERKELAIGLPAYRQGPGMMSAAIEGVRAVSQDPNSAEVSRTIYWSLAQLRASKGKAQFVAGIKGGSTS